MLLLPSKVKPKLLDLFCGGGGATRGYQLAGFYVTGIDIKRQPRYCGDRFIQADALEYLAAHWREYDAIHASPVCKRYSSITRTAGTQDSHPDQIVDVRVLLIATGKPYAIENIRQAPLKATLMLCGTMFGLRIERHRYFETNPVIAFSPATCCHWLKTVKHGRKPDRETQFAAATGHFSDVEYVQQVMGIDWLGQSGLSQALPPVYTLFVGRQLIKRLESYGG